MEVLKLFNKVRQIPPERLARAVWRKAAGQLKRYYRRGLLAVRGPHLSEREFTRALLGPLGSTENGAPDPPAVLPARYFLWFPAEGAAGLAGAVDIGAQGLREAAARAVGRRFNLLGSGWVTLDRSLGAEGSSGQAVRPAGEVSPATLPWHSDFKSGYAWDLRTFYKDICYGHVPGVDVKVPWELSRSHHLVTLGQAYALVCAEAGVPDIPAASQEDGSSAQLTPAACATEFVAQVEDWIQANPPMLGVNWVCTMDVAIRVCNWLVAWQLFQGAAEITHDFAHTFYRSLLEHGRFIRGNLEFSEILTSNHYLSDIVGLLYLGVLASQFKDATGWREFARCELVREMQKQIYPDGFDFEASTCYHRLVLELFFYSAWLCRRNGIELPPAFWERLRKMFEVVLYILKPNGRLPQLGDNDSGRLHILYPRDVLDGTYLLSYAAILFEDGNFKLPQFGLAPEAGWVFGREGVEKWRALPARAEPVGSRAFPDAGVYVMRHNDDYMLISCGPNGQNGNGGHAHNDKLSFELCLGGEEVIVDPGTYVYTSYPEWRNAFRSTAYHNTVVVDGQEQNPIEEEQVFRLPDLTRCRCLVWEPGPEKDVFVGEHYGYLRLDPPLVHRRTVEFYKKERTWVISDYLYQPEANRWSAGDPRRSRPFPRSRRGSGGQGRPGPGGTSTGEPGPCPGGNAPGASAGGLAGVGGAASPGAASPSPLTADAAGRPRTLEFSLHLAPGVEVVFGAGGAGGKVAPGACRASRADAHAACGVTIGGMKIEAGSGVHLDLELASASSHEKPTSHFPPLTSIFWAGSGPAEVAGVSPPREAGASAAAGGVVQDLGAGPPATLRLHLARASRVLAEVEAWGWEEMEPAGGWYSPEYGRKEEAGVVVLRSRRSCPAALRLVVRAVAAAPSG